MPIIIINSSTLDETREEITEQLNKFRQEDVVGQDNDVAVVVDGKTLTFALDHSLRQDFLDLCCRWGFIILDTFRPNQSTVDTNQVLK